MSCRITILTIEINIAAPKYDKIYSHKNEKSKKL